MKKGSVPFWLGIYAVLYSSAAWATLKPSSLIDVIRESDLIIVATVISIEADDDGYAVSYKSSLKPVETYKGPTDLELVSVTEFLGYHACYFDFKNRTRLLFLRHENNGWIQTREGAGCFSVHKTIEDKSIIVDFFTRSVQIPSSIQSGDFRIPVTDIELSASTCGNVKYDGRSGPRFSDSQISVICP